jgi:hypothetical protein
MGVDVRSMARNIIREKYAMQASQKVAPVQQTISPARNDIRSSLRQLMGDAIDSSGVGGGYRTGLENLAKGVDFAVDAVPLVGDAIAVQDTMDSYRRGDIVDTGINATAAALGVIPVVGDAAGRALQAGGKKVRSALRDIEPYDVRMQRAEEGGFDMDNVFYHGTSSDFTELKPSTVGDLGGGVYVTPNPEKAGSYAAVRKFMKRQTNNASPNVLPLRVKSDLNYLDLQGGSIMPFDKARINNLKEEGYDGIRQFDSDGNVIQMNVFDPKNIRSTNADFDPTKADSSNLLSGISRSSLRDIA